MDKALSCVPTAVEGYGEKLMLQASCTVSVTHTHTQLSRPPVIRVKFCKTSAYDRNRTQPLILVSSHEIDSAGGTPRKT